MTPLLALASLQKRLKKISGLLDDTTATVEEKGADFYDKAFYDDQGWSAHYTTSPYYFLWTVIIDRIRLTGRKKLLEIGCGTGQLAHALADVGVIHEYCGFDFSQVRVEHARHNCLNYRFEVADAFQTDLFTTVDYDIVVTTEFLEHVEKDLQVIESVRPGTYFLGTVPNFPFVSHVRHFANAEEVAQRYAGYFTNFRVDTFLANATGKTFFLCEGITREH